MLLRKLFGPRLPQALQERMDVDRSPRRSSRAWCSARRPMTLLLPATLMFTFCGIAYTFRWSNERSKAGPCVDCARQRAIAEEVYFGKRPSTATSKGSCL